MKIGYARVSTEDQNLALQRDALGAAGCERVFEDKESGAKADRPGLAEALAFARPGDVLTVWRLDRLGRSLPDLVRIVGELEQAGIGFESVTEKSKQARRRAAWSFTSSLRWLSLNATSRGKGRWPGLRPPVLAALGWPSWDRAGKARGPGSLGR